MLHRRNEVKRFVVTVSLPPNTSFGLLIRQNCLNEKRKYKTNEMILKQMKTQAG